MTADPFAGARRARIVGPLMMLVGGVLVYLGIAGSGAAWLLIVLGGAIVLLGFLRALIGFISIASERRRQRLLREGTPTTATVKHVKELGTRLGHTIMESKLEVALPAGGTEIVTRTGAIEPQYVGEVTVGAELPVRIDPDDPSTLAIAWHEL